MTFSEWLKQQLRKYNIKQADIAQACNVTDGNVSNWMAKRNYPSNSSIVAIADLLSNLYLPTYYARETRAQLVFDMIVMIEIERDARQTAKQDYNAH